MKRATVTVVDYGVGNLYSVRRAIEVCGADANLTGSPDEIASAERLVLPGVGAFEDGMRGLRERGLTEPVVEYARAGGPLLGICLGMQMLATQSEEFGVHAGLGLIPGRVVAIARRGHDDATLKVPYIGWTPLEIEAGLASGSCIESLSAEDAVYLVHSFHVVPDDRSDLLATYRRGGAPVTAAIRRGNVTGCQFHPEKSGPVGLEIVRRFIAQG